MAQGFLPGFEPKQQKRFFLGFDQPALHAAAEWLVDRYAEPAMLRMDRVTVALPTGRAKRRLSALISQITQRRELRYLPPSVVTLSEVPELLYDPQKPFASTQTQQFIWTKALRGLPAKDRGRLARSAEGTTNWSETRWLATGRIFWKLYRDLAAEGLGFRDVLRHGRKMEEFPDLSRWSAMAKLEKIYWDQLAELDLWDKQSARRFAVVKKECRFDGDLVFVGATDLNRALRNMLESENVTDSVTALVHAPESWEHRFDEFGCFITDKWSDREIELRDEQWSVCDTPEDQAEAVAEQLVEHASSCLPEEITIGCPDSRIVPYIQRQLHARETSSRWIGGRALSQTAPYQLLASIGRWIQSQHREDFAALARHPDLVALMLRNGIRTSWVGQLDSYHTRHLSARYDEWLGKPESREALEQAKALVDRLTAELREDARPISAWIGPLRGLLTEVYGHRNFQRDDPTDFDLLQSCQAITAGFSEFEKLPKGVAGPITAQDAIEIVLESISASNMIPPLNADAIEILGWLELALDESNVMIVAGVHDKSVPSSVSSHQFLPNRLREQLGIDDARRRYARDACILQTLLDSRSHIHFVMGRLTEDGDPLMPSRLLLSSSGDELVHRWKRVLRSRKSHGLAKDTTLANKFAPPWPQPSEPLRVMTVSAFKAYARCPYRFYLHHILGLRESHDDDVELASSTYGDLVHNVLEVFGTCDERNCADADLVRDRLVEILGEQARSQFGSTPLPAVRIQIEQLTVMITAYAMLQARRASEGWEIKFVEQPDGDSLTPFRVDGEDMMIRGRIDRIDQHSTTGEWEIIDYKTFQKVDKRKQPRHTHMQDGKWVDFQLPLYRHIAAGIGVSGHPKLSYLILPTSGQVKCEPADWTEEELESGFEAAREIVRNVRNGVFWPPSEPAIWSEPWDDICNVRTLEAVRS